MTLLVVAARMKVVGRRLLALSLSAALPIAALCAPLLHAHTDDDHEGHHGAGRIHAHLGGHGLDDHARDHHHVSDRTLNDHDALAATSSLEAEADPEQVTALQLFVGDKVGKLTPIGLRPLGFTLPVPLESVMRRPPAVSHSHDPPVSSPSRPRAPPVRLS